MAHQHHTCKWGCCVKTLCSSPIEEHLILIFSHIAVTLQCPLGKKRVAQPVDDTQMETFCQEERPARCLFSPSFTPLPAVLDSNGGGKERGRWAPPHLQRGPSHSVAWPGCTSQHLYFQSHVGLQVATWEKSDVGIQRFPLPEVWWRRSPGAAIFTEGCLEALLNSRLSSSTLASGKQLPCVCLHSGQKEGRDN